MTIRSRTHPFTPRFVAQLFYSAQLGFVLNLEQHWYALRRFGETSPDPDINLHHSVGHWFNLNSSLERPEWISKLYLGMVLQQAEADGKTPPTFLVHDGH